MQDSVECLGSNKILPVGALLPLPSLHLSDFYEITGERERERRGGEIKGRWKNRSIYTSIEHSNKSKAIKLLYYVHTVLHTNAVLQQVPQRTGHTRCGANPQQEPSCLAINLFKVFIFINFKQPYLFIVVIIPSHFIYLLLI